MPSSDVFVPSAPPPSITSSELTVIDSLEGDSLEELGESSIWASLFGGNAKGDDDNDDDDSGDDDDDEGKKVEAEEESLVEE